MTKEQFIDAQDELGLNNAQLGAKLFKCAQSVSNYRTGRQKVPRSVEAAIKLLVAQKRDKK